MEEPIAIVGLDARMPGGDNPDAFFDFLCSGRSARSAVPSSRFNAQGFVAPSSSSEIEGARIVSTHGHFLEGSINAFDAPFFSITPAEAAGIDPQQRNMLETVYKALENAGITLPRAAGTRTGVYVGCSSADFRDVSLKDLDGSLRYAGTGTIISMLSNRVSWFYDFTGPSMTIDTACSSSLVALHQAVMALRNGSISMAIVGGTNLLLSPEMSMSFSAMGVLSPDGISYSFDHRANGFSRGEGFAAIVLKRLSDALRDGDSESTLNPDLAAGKDPPLTRLGGFSCSAIRAVIRNSGVNQDGHSPALTHSTRASLLDLIHTTYRGLDMSLTRFVEAHGTGTRVGDPIETGALADCFAAHRTAEEPLYVGALKSSCGHLEGAAGLAGVVKTVLSLERGIIPSNTWFEKPNPSILPDWHLAFPTEPVPWPRTATGLRRASVNCFGLGGTNAHVVLDDALHFLHDHGLVGRHCTVENADRGVPANVPEGCPRATNGTPALDDHTRPALGPSTDTEGADQDESIEAASTPPSVASGQIGAPACSKLFSFTAHDQDGVPRLRQAYETHLSALDSTHTKGPSSQQFLCDLSFTLAAKRTHFPWRTAIIANSTESLRMSLEAQDQAAPVRAEDSRRLAFAFTGQGSQWPAMGMGLMAYPVFRRSMEKADAYLKSLGSPWSLIYELTKKSGMSRVDEAEFSQPLCTALQVALVDLVAAWKVTAGAVVGHSSGEIAAAYAAKAVSAEDAWRLAYYRGKLAAKLVKAGSQPRTGMAAVGLDHVQAMAAIQDLKRRHFRYPGHMEVACFNSRTSHTISGELDRIEALVAKLNHEKVFAKKLQVQVGYHSQYMQPIADEYARMIGHVGADSVSPESSASRFYSSTVGAVIDNSKLKSAAYWVDNMVSSVLFQQSLAAMLAEDGGIQEGGLSIPVTDVLVIGPHRGLKGPIGQASKDSGRKDFQYHFMMESGSDEVSSVLSAAGTLFSRGISIDITLVNQQDMAHRPNMLTSLPSYPFNHTKEYWSESRLSKAFAHRQYGRHEVLGTPVAHNSPHNSMWHHWLRLAEIPWLKDHQVGESTLFPAAGMLAMAVEAARQAAGRNEDIQGFRLRQVSFHTALNIPGDGTGVETYFHLQRVGQAASGASEASSRESNEFQLWSVSQDNEWREHCRGTILVEHKETATPVDGGLEDGELSGRCDSRMKQATAACRCRIPSELMYQLFAEGDLKFGETFQTLTDVCMDDPLAPRMATASLRPNLSYYGADETREGVMLHPTMIDGILQAGLAPLLVGRDANHSGKPRVPVRIDEFWISAQSNWQDPIIPVQSDVAFSSRSEARCSCAAVSKQTGEPVVLVNGLLWKAAAALATDADKRDQDPRHRAWNIDWKPDVTLLSRDKLESAFRPGEEPDRWVYTDLDDCNELSARYVRRTLQLPNMEEGPLNRHIRNDSGVELPSEDAEPPSLVSRPSHLQRYVEFMKQLVAEQQRQGSGEGSESMETLESRVANRATAHGKLVMAVGKELKNILDGTVDPLEILFGTTFLAEQFYLTGYGAERTSAQLGGYLDALAHKRPLMKILEVGAGTGGTAKPVLDRLASRYCRYDFTDVSSTFLEKAQEKLAGLERVHYRVLDIERDPSAQGFAAGTYDVLIATHVLHATRDVVVTLRNCLALLKPGGKLLLTETTRPATLMSHFVFGLFPGWWKSENEDRLNGPLLTAEAWEGYARQSGFAGFDAVFPDYSDDRHGLSSVLVCSAPDDASRQFQDGESPEDPPPGDLIIVADPVSDLQDGVVEAFKRAMGNAVTGPAFRRILSRTLADMAREGHECNPDSTCIVFTELKATTLANMSEDSLAALQYVFQCKTVLWLTKAGAPEREVVRGFAAGVRLESPQMKLMTISFDEPSLDTPHTIAETSWRVLEASLKKSVVDTDNTFHFADGHLHIPRLVEAKYLTDYMQSAAKRADVVEAEFGKDPDSALRLQIEDLGLLDTLRFEEDPRSAAPLGDYDVEVRTMASGVNFHDLSVMLGRMGETPLGLEGAGVITRTGAQVTRFSPGDKVFGLAFEGAFQTRFRTKEGLLAHMPDLLAFTDAAAIPVVYTTAVACLFDIGGLDELVRQQMTHERSGRPSVLIHAAAGGVGQAAIQLAQREGAEIYATVGSLEKRDFLEKTYNIPRDHILSSRDLTFRDGVLRMTDGRGVDIVLNSLSGDALRATWDCVAPFGRFAEIGLVDIHAQAGLSMAPFGRNARFEAVSLEYMAQHAPRRLERLFRRTVRAVLERPLDGGALAPSSTPVAVYPFSQVQAAMRHMQSGKHVGKLVLEPRRDDVVPVLASYLRGRLSRFDGNATYVVAGGLGGLGRAVVGWMVERGARYLLLLSRRGLPPADIDKMFDGVKGRYDRIVAPACDVTDLAVLRRVFQDCASTLPPIRGCVQGGMVLRDMDFQDMTVPDWQASVQVKVAGSKNLWAVLSETNGVTKPLSFFIMLSSATSILGNPEQSNYITGNAFQDAFARELAYQGHPAVSINIPMLSDVGFVAERPELLHHLGVAGWPYMSSRELLVALEYYCFPREHFPDASGLAREDRVCRAQVAPRLWLPRLSQVSGQMASGWDKSPLLQPLKLWQHAEGGGAHRQEDTSEAPARATRSAKDRLASAATLKEAREVVLEAFLGKLSRILSVGEAELSPSKPLHAYGVDSLVAVELRSWFTKEVAAELTVLDMTSQGCIRQVAELAAARSAGFTGRGGGS